MTLKIRRHKEIDLDDAEAGSVLSQDVLDGKGGVLLPQGATLTAGLLRSLQRRGIDRVFVLNDVVTEEELEAERERTQARLNWLFRKVRGAHATDALFSALIQYRMEQLQ